MILYPMTFIVAALVAYLATIAMRAYSLKASIMDQPNERSLHKVLTPRGGGVGIVVAISLATLSWFAKGTLPSVLGEIVALATGMAALGYWDDRVSLTAKLRLRTQLLLSLVLSIALQRAFGPIAWGEALGVTLPTVVVSIFVLLFALWMTNLFNFMDGSDGIAGTQALMVGLGFLALAVIKGSPEAATIAAIVAGAAFGFLILNWQPAKIFMGDVGSVYLGFLFASLTMWMALQDVAPFAALLVVQGMFIVDATVTLIRRLMRGKKPQVAHRSHAYQRLVQSGWSHSRVASLYGAITLLWLLPMSIVSAHLVNGSIGEIDFAGWGPWAALVVAWAPVALFVISMRAGEDFEA